MITQIAADLTAWTRLLGCVGDAVTLATCEPKAVRYRFPPRARPTRSQRTPTSPQDPGVTALGNRDRRGLREHRRHPATGPTWPVRPRHHHPENRSPAAPAGPSSYPQSLHTRAHSTTPLRHDPDRRHERPGLSASAWSPRQGQTEELPGSQPLPRSPLNSDPTSPLRGLLQSQPQDRRAARGQQVPRRRSASRGSGRELSLPTRGTRRGPESCNPCISCHVLHDLTPGITQNPVWPEQYGRLGVRVSQVQILSSRPSEPAPARQKCLVGAGFWCTVPLMATTRNF